MSAIQTQPITAARLKASIVFEELAALATALREAEELAGTNARELCRCCLQDAFEFLDNIEAQAEELRRVMRTAANQPALTEQLLMPDSP